ncbi:MAG: Ku protein [Candidatus Omnitrophota bacterium]
MRSIWSGVVSFGLVNIPVKLYTAVEPEKLQFHYLRKSDQCPIKYRKECEESGEEVPFSEIVKGYEYEKGKYIVMTDEDFEKADLERTGSIDILSFIHDSEIDFKLVEKPYFLEPDKKAQKTYALFREALKESSRAGIGKFVLRSREHLTMLRAEKDVIMLYQLRFAQTIRSYEDLNLPGQMSIARNEMDLAKELIDKYAEKFQPERYRDTYEEKIMAIIEEKAKGRTPVAHGKPRQVTEAADLMAKLKASLAGASR